MFDGIHALDRGLRLFAKARKEIARSLDLIRQHKTDNDAQLQADHAKADEMLDRARQIHLAAEEHRLVSVTDHGRQHEMLEQHENRALNALSHLDQMLGA